MLPMCLNYLCIIIGALGPGDTNVCLGETAILNCTIQDLIHGWEFPLLQRSLLVSSAIPLDTRGDFNFEFLKANFSTFTLPISAEFDGLTVQCLSGTIPPERFPPEETRIQICK